MKTVLAYIYYKWTMVHPMGIIGTDPDRYMANLRKIVEKGWFEHVIYTGQLNCTCGGQENFGGHYAFIIQTDEQTMDEILDVLDYDVDETFQVMEDAMKELETVTK